MIECLIYIIALIDIGCGMAWLIWAAAESGGETIGDYIEKILFIELLRKGNFFGKIVIIFSYICLSPYILLIGIAILLYCAIQIIYRLINRLSGWNKE